VRLSDGRNLNFFETGFGSGVPVVYCHGAIGTPLNAAVDLEAITRALGIRHISISRPGIGGSDPAPERTLLDFAGDVGELADALGLERFAVVGVSAGGPYALAVAHELPERVSQVAVCSSLSPLSALHRTPGMQRRIRLALAAMARAPDLWTTVGDAALPVIRRHPELLTRVIAMHAAPGERRRLREPDERASAATSFLDAASWGVRGLIDDYLVYSREWGFSAGAIEAEVHLWHGLRDPLVPIEHALQLAVTIPHCRVFFDPDEGHHFFRRRLRTILAVLLGHQQDAEDELAVTVDHARTIAGHRAKRPRR
jgi:pimeloyl-ACP methyl ester carboxylesterase